MLAVVDHLRHAVGEGIVGLARQAEDQVRIGLDPVAREAPLQFLERLGGDVLALDRLERVLVD